MTVKDKDKGAKAMLARLGKSPSVRVGVIGREAQERGKNGGSTVGEIASYHEFGLGVPRRSFIRDYVDQNRLAITAKIDAIGGRIVGGLDPKKGMDLLGLYLVGEIQDRISDHIPPPLAESTIERKGSDTPLIDTGQLRSSITHAVEGV
jgi:hypothetical protein